MDHYALDEEWEARLRLCLCQDSPRMRILVLDDLADRLHDADILLDQNHAELREHLPVIIL